MCQRCSQLASLEHVTTTTTLASQPARLPARLSARPPWRFKTASIAPRRACAAVEGGERRRGAALSPSPSRCGLGCPPGSSRRRRPGSPSRCGLESVSDGHSDDGGSDRNFGSESNVGNDSNGVSDSGNGNVGGSGGSGSDGCGSDSNDNGGSDSNCSQ